MSIPDFDRIVLRALKPRTTAEQDACRELADHLADQYQEAITLGGSPEIATARALSQLHQPARLRRLIRRAQGGSMRDSFRKVLLPGVVSAIPLGFYGLVLEQYIGLRSPAYFFWGVGAFVFYWYMLPAFAAAGALGAWYSRHQGGTLTNRLVAATFVAILNVLMFTVPFPFALAADRQLWAVRILQVYAGYLLSQAVVPGIAMLIGALPFLFGNGEYKADDRQVSA